MAKGAQEIDGQLTDDIDIYRTTKLYINQHGDQAALQAAMQADALLEAAVSTVPRRGGRSSRRLKCYRRLSRTGRGIDCVKRCGVRLLDDFVRFTPDNGHSRQAR